MMQYVKIFISIYTIIDTIVFFDDCMYYTSSTLCMDTYAIHNISVVLELHPFHAKCVKMYAIEGAPTQVD